MPRIDFTPKCKQCGREIKLEEVFDPCPQCGFENLKDSCQKGEKAARKMKDPDYHGPTFAKELVVDLVKRRRRNGRKDKTRRKNRFQDQEN